MLVRALLLVALTLSTAPALAAEPVSAEARAESERQIRFARGELAENRFDRALASAESSLRLCPECREAVLLKALAYDGLGDRRLGVELLAAFKEEAPHEDWGRADKVLQWFEATPRTRPENVAAVAAGFTEATGLAAAPASDLDPAPFAARFQNALAAKHCTTALVAAKEWTRLRPEDPGAAKAAGAAAVCASDVRFAALTLQRWDVLGVSDDRERLEATASSAATLTLRVTPGQSKSTWLLDVDGEWIAPAKSGGTLVFAALPPQVEGILVAVAPGGSTPSVTERIGPLRPAEARTMRAPR